MRARRNMSVIIVAACACPQRVIRRYEEAQVWHPLMATGGLTEYLCFRLEADAQVVVQSQIARVYPARAQSIYELFAHFG